MWPMIIGLAIQAIIAVIKWMNSKETLSSKQQQRLNHLILKCNELRSLAGRMGCNVNGEEDLSFASPVAMEMDADE